MKKSRLIGILVISIIIFFSYIYPTKAYSKNIDYIYPGFYHIFNISKIIKFPFETICSNDKFLVIRNNKELTLRDEDFSINLLRKNGKKCLYMFIGQNLLPGYYQIFNKDDFISFIIKPNVSLYSKFIGISDIWQFGDTISLFLNRNTIDLIKNIGITKIRIFVKYSEVTKYGWELYDTIIKNLTFRGFSLLIDTRCENIDLEECKIFTLKVIKRYKDYSKEFEIENEVNVKKMWKYSVDDYINLINYIKDNIDNDIYLIVGATASFATNWWEKFLSKINLNKFDAISIHIYRKIQLSKNSIFIEDNWGRETFFNEFTIFKENILDKYLKMKKELYVTEFGFNTKKIDIYKNPFAVDFIPPYEQAMEFFKLVTFLSSTKVKSTYNFLLVDTYGFGTGFFESKDVNFRPKPILSVFYFVLQILNYGPLKMKTFSDEYVLLENKKYFIIFQNKENNKHSKNLSTIKNLLIEKNLRKVYNIFGAEYIFKSYMIDKLEEYLKKFGVIIFSR